MSKVWLYRYTCAMSVVVKKQWLCLPKQPQTLKNYHELKWTNESSWIFLNFLQCTKYLLWIFHSFLLLFVFVLHRWDPPCPILLPCIRILEKIWENHFTVRNLGVCWLFFFEGQVADVPYPQDFSEHQMWKFLMWLSDLKASRVLR